jgi:2-keto-4-pentenoate hydratase/2-oxohepta-3-ene-1,7-dioic acid hydratase in catechol pathway
MKLIAFLAAGQPRFGALLADPERAVDFAALRAGRSPAPALPAPRSLLELITQGEAGLAEARRDLEQAAAGASNPGVYPLAAVRLLAPTGRPPKLLCFSVYEGHMKNAMAASLVHKLGRWRHVVKALGLARIPKGFYRRPLYFKGNAASCSGPDEEIVWPATTRELDYEMELGVVLGRRGMNVRAEDALDYVFGYTVFNDWSARDLMSQEILALRGPLKGKDFGNGNTLGPCVVTKDEIPDPQKLSMQVRVNGELRGQASTAEMTHGIAAQIAEASRHEPIIPGEVIGSGCATTGCGYEQLRFLKPGDVVEIEIEKIGLLRNRVAQHSC